MVKNIWDKVIEFTEKKYDLNIDTADMRFMYVVYWFIINERNNIVMKQTMKRLHKDYLKQFGDIDRQSFVAFERSVYRVYNKINHDIEISFLEFIKNIIKEI